MGFFKQLFGHDSETDDQREERLYREQNSSVPVSTGACYVVDDVFSVGGRGTVVVGKVTKGAFSVGDKVKIDDRSGNAPIESKITAVEMFMKQVRSASAGENAGLLLGGIDRNQVKKGDLIIK